MFFNKKKNNTYTSVIIAAAGSGSRMGAGINKIFLELGGIPVLARTLTVFERCDKINEIILVASEKEIMKVTKIATDYGISKLKTVTAGGETRQQSVKKGLAEVSENADVVLVHDAARPLIEEKTICEVIECTISNGAAACGNKNKNTVKKIDNDGFIEETLDRERLVEIQTPQGFKRDLIISSYELAERSGFSATDDCMIVENAGKKIKVVFSGSDNIKVTTFDDLALAEMILEKRGE